METHKHTTAKKEDFLRWLPEITPRLFENFSVAEIRVEVESSDGTRGIFTYKRES